MLTHLLQVAFDLYDIDGDGAICNGDLFKTLKLMVGGNLTDTQLQQIVDKTFLQADEDKDGLISFAEFMKVQREPVHSLIAFFFHQMVDNKDEIHSKLTISFD